MLNKLIKKFFGDHKEREIKKISPLVDEINKHFVDLDKLSDDELRARITEIREDIRTKLTPLEEEYEELAASYQTEADENKKHSIGNKMDVLKKQLKEENQLTLDGYLVEVFAIIKDTCRRLVGYEYDVRGDHSVWDMVPFDVQLIGGIILHRGMIAEMATGEGKTLVATMPLFLNALLGHGSHLITVNDYLAQRDMEWMAPVFQFHGLTVSCNINGLSYDEKKAAYACDVTYGTNSEFGFDYLRDNMAVSEARLTQRKLHYSIVDEVDSVLIDEARTPLIISGPVQESKNFYHELTPIIRNVVQAQSMLVQRMLSEVRADLSKETYDSTEIGTKLVQLKRAAPKNKTFNKMLKDPELKKLLSDTESWLNREKRIWEIGEDLFYVVEERQNSVELTEKGNEAVAKKDPNLFIVQRLDDMLNKIDEQEELSFEEKAKQKEEATSHFIDKNEKLHNIKQLLKAYTLFEREVEYVVAENKVMIVDEFTGRMMPGRRFSDGLHQALEAKENVKIEDATQTFATITLQNYFRMYEKLAGMTGTAITEEHEFQEIYQLPVMEIPTNRPISRIDHDDLIYLTKNEKYQAIQEEIEYWHKKGKPVLVGTVTVDVSETLSRLLRRKGIPHNVLNAKYHEQEADIIKLAGSPGAVTIATNMAGRGTDIKLGDTVVTKNKEDYLEYNRKLTDELPFGLPIDGLHVIGTERHESRRIDRQLRGRAGRQGDPGTSRFYLSMEDDLMRLFAPDRLAPMMMKLGFQEGEAIMHPWMTKAVEKAQTRVEAYNFEARKQLLKYDEVMNQQREVIYTYRRNVLKGYDLKLEIMEMIKDSIHEITEDYIGEIRYAEEWPLDELLQWIRSNLNVNIEKDAVVDDRTTVPILIENISEALMQAYEKREEEMTSEQMREIERRALLSVVDELWRDHLHEMDLLKEGIGFRAYAQKDPLVEYKRESFILFQKLVSDINKGVMKKVYTTYLVTAAQLQDMMRNANQSHASASAFQSAGGRPQAPVTNQPVKTAPRKVEHKVGRNDPCPCGSGKKYKKCCGSATLE